MQKIILSIFTIALATTAWGQTLDRSIRPKPGPAPEIKLGKTESFTLANGLKVFVVENHKLPTISCSIQLDIKPELEGDMAGYGDMMSDLLTSGTKTRSNDQLNKEIDFIGASISASQEGVSGDGLKKHQDKILELMSDIAINADIKGSELEKIRTRTLSGLEAEANSPDAMLNNVSAALNFGKQHPYGEVANDETIKNITLEKVRKYYQTYFRPNVAYMAIVGDVTVEEMKPLVEKYFGGWQQAPVPVAQYSDPKAPVGTRVAFVPRDAAVQSVVNITYPIDLKYGSPDVIKSKVANSILGGGANGRLFLNLREKHGWTYGSYSSIDQDAWKGSFTAYSKNRNAVTDSSVTQMLAEMKRLRTQKVGKEELQNHIVNMSGSFAMSLENPGTIAQFAINTERYKMPKNYYANYLKNLAAVTPEDVQAAAIKYIDPAKANIVVVGSKDEVAKTLKQFDSKGSITYYDNYGRVIKPAVTAAAPSNMTGDAVVKKYIAAIGGESVVSSIKDIKTVSSGAVQGITLKITEIKKAPSQLKFTMEGMGMVLQKKVLNGDKGYMEAQGQKQALEGDDLEEAKENADIYADLHPEKYGKKRSLKGIDKVNGADAYIVEEVNAKGDKKTAYYDVASGYLVKAVETGDSPQGPMTQTTEYGDYQEVPGSGGYKIPHTVKINAGPQVISIKVETAEVNKNVSDSEFE